MESLPHQFLRNLYNAPPNGIYSHWFEKKYKLSYKQVDKEIEKLVRLGWATKDVKSKQEFIAKIAPLGSQNWDTVYFPQVIN